jgi:quercetin dioxygenase-like cupin family protein
MHVMKVTLALLLLTLPLAAAEPPAGTIQVDAAKLEWKATKAPLPAGTELAVLEGDPKQPGMFTIRLRIPAGAKLPPHTHPVVERVTVLSGEVHVGFGDQPSMLGTHRFRAGDFYINPPGAHHFVFFPKTTIIQITTEGPWTVTPVG